MENRRYISRFVIETENKVERVAKMQKLKDHLSEVSQLAATFAEPVGLKNTMRLAGILHDVGKYARNFQDYIYCEMEKNLTSKYNNTLQHSKIDHAVYGAKHLYQQYYEKDQMDKLTVEILILICCYHHGGLPDCLNDKGAVPVIERFSKVDDKELGAVMKCFYKENDIKIDELYQKAKKEVVEGFNKISHSRMSRKEQQFSTGMLIKLCYSMLVDADRLDSMCFGSDTYTWETYLHETELNKAFTKYQINMESFLTRLKTKTETGTKSRKSKVNTVRSSISDECLEKSVAMTGTYNLTVPTGGGKTFASMRFALNHNIKNKKRRIIYVIPYTSIIEQNADEFRKALGSECDLLENHSNVIDDNKRGDYELYSTRWNNDIIVTTMVQFLNTFYSRGTQNIRRFHNLLNAVIIIDEVQTIPVRCMNLFNSALNFLNQFGNTSAVLCTATQPVLNIKTMIPLIKAKNPEIIGDVSGIFGNLKRVKIVNCCNQAKYTSEQLIEFIEEKKRSVNSLLVVLNKVKSAQNIFKELKSLNSNNVELFYLSSSLCPQHKREVLNQLKVSLEAQKQLICVSTAVIEAGVDISFNMAVRNLTKLDSIAQTAGRVNRNGENEQGICYVVNYEEGSYSKMIEVDIGGKRAGEIMDKYEDVLIPEAMEEYFTGYYSERSIYEKFDFPLEHKKNKNIYEILLPVMKNNKGAELLPISINFAEAANDFEVIDKNTKSVIVPYKEGKKMIDEMQFLSQYSSAKERMELLHKAQRYSVNIFFYNEERLKEMGALIQNEVLGVNVLSDGYYDEDTGVVYEAITNQFLC